MSLFLVVEEAKIYRQFSVYAESPAQAKALVERYADTLAHSSHLVPGEREVVEIWIEEATVPVWQVEASPLDFARDDPEQEQGPPGRGRVRVEGSENGSPPEHGSEERSITSSHES